MVMSDKELKKIATEEFEAVWEEYKKELNGSRLEKYNEQKWFKKLFDTKKYELLDKEVIKGIAELFFHKGENKGMAYAAARNRDLLREDEK